MTAQIVAFSHPNRAPEIIAERPTSPANGRLTPATVRAIEGDVPMSRDAVVVATMALGVACREMEASLAILVAHCGLR
jgi:hypothetical protein